MATLQEEQPSNNHREETQELPITTAAAAATGSVSKKITLVPLIFLIYFEVAGGPYGEEPTVKAAGPLLSILGFLIFPFIWSAPEALITAELCTTFPGNGGYVIWAERAFGTFWGSLMGSWKFLSGVINIATFPVLCINYMEKIIPALHSGLPRTLAILISNIVLAIVNYTGLAIVGYVSILFGVISLAPFILMSLIAIPKIRPHRWVSLGQKGVKKDWALFFNTLFWNLNFWDNVSTVAGEIDQPQKTFPKGLFIAVIFTCLAYLIPLVAVTGAVSVDQNEWESGFMATAAEIISGSWLKFWIEIGSVVSSIGLYEAQLSTCSYQILGMAETAILPKFFGVKSKWFNTPWLGILISAGISLGVSYLSFSDLVASANFLYSLGMLLEFASFVWLRKKYPNLKRPYRVPLGIPALIVMFIVPSAFLIYIMVLATKTVLLVSGIMTAGGIVLYLFMWLCRSKRWLLFRHTVNYAEEDDEQQ